MRRGLRLAALICAAGVIVAACGGGSDKKSSGTTTTATAAPKATTASSSPSAATVAATKPSGQGKLPADACALLTADEVHTLLPAAGAGKVLSDTTGPAETTVACRWELETAIGTLIVSVSTFTGVSGDSLTASLRAEAKDSGREVTGVGDFAIVTSTIPADAEVKALSGGRLVDVELKLAGAKDKQEAVIALAKAVIGRL